MQDPELDRPALEPPVEAAPLARTSLPGWRIRYLDAAGSTNAEAKAALVAGEGTGAGAGLVVVTDHQTAGRGRLDRTWETPAGMALTFSAVLDPGVPDSRWPWLPLLTGLAVAQAVRRTGGVQAALKWPNDVLIGDRKLAGILVERVAGPARALAVVGVGVNVHQTRLPVETATSLALQGAAVDRALLLGEILGGLSERVARWRYAGGDPAALREEYLALCVTLGQQVRVQLPGEATLSGSAESIDADGRLVVRPDGGGAPRAVGAGDVIHVRKG